MILVGPVARTSTVINASEFWSVNPKGRYHLGENIKK
jgi:hypothetical protein